MKTLKQCFEENPGYDWIAQDENGCVYVHSATPALYHGSWECEGNTYIIGFITPDWGPLVTFETRCLSRISVMTLTDRGCIGYDVEGTKDKTVVNGGTIVMKGAISQSDIDAVDVAAGFKKVDGVSMKLVSGFDVEMAEEVAALDTTPKPADLKDKTIAVHLHLMALAEPDDDLKKTYSRLYIALRQFISPLPLEDQVGIVLAGANQIMFACLSSGMGRLASLAERKGGTDV